MHGIAHDYILQLEKSGQGTSKLLVNRHKLVTKGGNEGVE